MVKTVLLIEDDLVVSNYLSIKLNNKFGFEVAACSSLTEARRLALEQKFDLIVSDTIFAGPGQPTEGLRRKSDIIPETSEINGETPIIVMGKQKEGVDADGMIFSLVAHIVRPSDYLYRSNPDKAVSIERERVLANKFKAVEYAIKRHLPHLAKNPRAMSAGR